MWLFTVSPTWLDVERSIFQPTYITDTPLYWSFSRFLYSIFHTLSSRIPSMVVFTGSEVKIHKRFTTCWKDSLYPETCQKEKATGDKITGGDNLTQRSRCIMHTQSSSILTCVHPSLIQAPVHLVTICACCASNHPFQAVIETRWTSHREDDL